MQPKGNHKFEVGPDAADLRLDKFLSLRFTDISRSFLQKLITDGHIRVNARCVRPSYPMKLLDRVEVHFPPPVPTTLLPEAIPLDIIYEDADLLVINKAAGMVVHPGNGIRNGTLANALMGHCRDLSGIGGRLRPGIVHRLDKNTSGLIVAAKNDRAHLALQKQFATKTAIRRYKALVWGTFDESEGKIETFVNRSKSDRKKFSVSAEGKLAVTLYKVEKRFNFLSLIDVQLKTGRTHQIRIHFNYLHHPVFGDPEYAGRDKQLRGLAQQAQKREASALLKIMNRQALHAYYLGFRHPGTGEWREFSAKLPEDYRELLKALSEEEASFK